MTHLLTAWITWSGDPILFRIPRWELPFELSFLGLILSAGMIFWLNQAIKAPGRDEGKRRRTGGRPSGTSSGTSGWKTLLAGSTAARWTAWILVIAAGQLATLPLDGPGISSIGPIEPRWYGVMFACAFFFGYLYGSSQFRDFGLKNDDIDRLLVYVIVSTIIGARLGHVIFYDPVYFFSHPWLIPQIWTGGLASHGAAIAIPIALWLYARKTKGIRYLEVMDRVVGGVAVGGFFIRFGNFFNSEILGRPTDVPWAVIFSRIDDLPRHPTMLYESLWCLVVLASVHWIYIRWNRRPPEGSMFGTFLIVLFTGRFVLEFTKMPQTEFAMNLPLDMGQLLSIPFVLLGIWLVAKAFGRKG